MRTLILGGIAAVVLFPATSAQGHPAYYHHDHDDDRVAGAVVGGILGAVVGYGLGGYHGGYGYYGGHRHWRRW